MMERNAVTSTGVVVCWQSVAGKPYKVERSANLTLAPPFIEIATNIGGQVESTTYVDTTAVGQGPYFYRVGVE